MSLSVTNYSQKEPASSLASAPSVCGLSVEKMGRIKQEYFQAFNSHLYRTQGFVPPKTWEQITISTCYDKMQEVQDENLQKVFGRIYSLMHKEDFGETFGFFEDELGSESLKPERLLAGIPDPEASAEAIRFWMAKTTDFFSNIRRLNLSHLGLSMIPSEISLCIGLQILDLSSNCLRSLPQFMKEFTCLRSLKLNHNYLMEINNLRGLPLEVLGLTHNKIWLGENYEMSLGAIKSLGKLKYLYLMKNPIACFPVSMPSWLEGVLHLECVDRWRLEPVPLPATPLPTLPSINSLREEAPAKFVPGPVVIIRRSEQRRPPPLIVPQKFCACTIL